MLVGLADLFNKQFTKIIFPREQEKHGYLYCSCHSKNEEKCQPKKCSKKKKPKKKQQNKLETQKVASRNQNKSKCLAVDQFQSHEIPDPELSSLLENATRIYKRPGSTLQKIATNSIPVSKPDFNNKSGCVDLLSNLLGASPIDSKLQLKQSNHDSETAIEISNKSIEVVKNSIQMSNLNQHPKLGRSNSLLIEKPSNPYKNETDEKAELKKRKTPDENLSNSYKHETDEKAEFKKRKTSDENLSNPYKYEIHEKVEFKKRKTSDEKLQGIELTKEETLPKVKALPKVNNLPKNLSPERAINTELTKKTIFTPNESILQTKFFSNENEYLSSEPKLISQEDPNCKPSFDNHSSSDDDLCIKGVDNAPLKLLSQEDPNCRLSLDDHSSSDDDLCIEGVDNAPLNTRLMHFLNKCNSVEETCLVPNNLDQNENLEMLSTASMFHRVANATHQDISSEKLCEIVNNESSLNTNMKSFPNQLFLFQNCSYKQKRAVAFEYPVTEKIDHGSCLNKFDNLKEDLNKRLSAKAKDGCFPPGTEKEDFIIHETESNECMPPGTKYLPFSANSVYCLPPGTETDDCLPPGTETNDCLPPGTENDDCLPPGTENNDCLPPGTENDDCLPPGTENNDCLPPGTENGYCFPPGTENNDCLPTRTENDDSLPPGTEGEEISFMKIEASHKNKRVGEEKISRMSRLFDNSAIKNDFITNEASNLKIDEWSRNFNELSVQSFSPFFSPKNKSSNFSGLPHVNSFMSQLKSQFIYPTSSQMEGQPNYPPIDFNDPFHKENFKNFLSEHNMQHLEQLLTSKNPQSMDRYPQPSIDKHPSPFMSNPQSMNRYPLPSIDKHPSPFMNNPQSMDRYPLPSIDKHPSPFMNKNSPSMDRYPLPSTDKHQSPFMNKNPPSMDRYPLPSTDKHPSPFMNKNPPSYMSRRKPFENDVQPEILQSTDEISKHPRTFQTQRNPSHKKTSSLMCASVLEMTNTKKCYDVNKIREKNQRKKSEKQRAASRAYLESRKVEMKREAEKKRHDASLPCPFFKKKGFCDFGDQCRFSHNVEVEQIIVLCKFYAVDACRKGKNCIFMHEKWPCRFYHVFKSCNQGSSCKYSHEQMTPEVQKAFEEFESSQEDTRSADNTVIPSSSPTVSDLEKKNEVPGPTLSKKFEEENQASVSVEQKTNEGFIFPTFYYELS